MRGWELLLGTGSRLNTAQGKGRRRQPSSQALSTVFVDMRCIYVCGAVAASAVISMEVLSDYRNDFYPAASLRSIF